MKMLRLLLLVIAISVTSIHCSKDDSTGGGGDSDSKVEANGLTRDINDLIPANVLTSIKNIGMTIYTGETPPTLNKIYSATPFLLQNTSVPNDFDIGHAFAEYRFQFQNQNNTNLTVTFSYKAGTETGTGIGAWIVGTGNNFTVFAEIESQISGSTAQTVTIISGTLTDTGVTNLKMAYWMLDNNGDTSTWIGNNTGRVFHDSDGSSPIVTSLTPQLLKNKAQLNVGVIK